MCLRCVKEMGRFLELVCHRFDPASPVCADCAHKGKPCELVGCFLISSFRRLRMLTCFSLGPCPLSQPSCPPLGCRGRPNCCEGCRRGAGRHRREGENPGRALETGDSCRRASPCQSLHRHGEVFKGAWRQQHLVNCDRHDAGRPCRTRVNPFLGIIARRLGHQRRAPQGVHGAPRKSCPVPV